MHFLCVSQYCLHQVGDAQANAPRSISFQLNDFVSAKNVAHYLALLLFQRQNDFYATCSQQFYERLANYLDHYRYLEWDTVLLTLYQQYSPQTKLELES